LCVAGTLSWCPGRCPRRRSLSIAGLCSFIVVPKPLPAAVLVVRQRYFAVSQHLLKLSANLVTALAPLHVKNLARRSSLEAGSKRDKKGGKKRRNVRNSVW
jgi:hypothetical protein